MSFAVLAVGLIVATVVDLRTRRIPNVLTGTMAATGLALAAFGFTSSRLARPCSDAVIGLVLMLPGHVLGATGAGDVKLMAAVGSLLGPLAIVNAVLFTAVAGGVLAVMWRCRESDWDDAGGHGSNDCRAGRSQTRDRSEAAASRFAYGPAIAVGSLFAALLQ